MRSRRRWSEDQSRIKVGYHSASDNSKQEIFLGLTICEESLKHICTYSIRSWSLLNNYYQKLSLFDNDCFSYCYFIYLFYFNIVIYLISILTDFYIIMPCTASYFYWIKYTGCYKQSFSLTAKSLGNSLSEDETKTAVTGRGKVGVVVVVGVVMALSCQWIIRQARSLDVLSVNKSLTISISTSNVNERQDLIVLPKKIPHLHCRFRPLVLMTGVTSLS